MSNTQTNPTILSDVLISPIRIKEWEILMESVMEKVISKYAKPHSQTDHQKPFRLKAAADFIGVAETTLYSLVHQGRIKPLKPGKHLLFTKESLDAYLRGGRPEAQEKPDPSTYLLRNKKAAQ